MKVTLVFNYNSSKTNSITISLISYVNCSFV
jgi:hypothetical protein